MNTLHCDEFLDAPRFRFSNETPRLQAAPPHFLAITLLSKRLRGEALHLLFSQATFESPCSASRLGPEPQARSNLFAWSMLSILRNVGRRVFSRISFLGASPSIYQCKVFCLASKHYSSLSGPGSTIIWRMSCLHRPPVCPNCLLSSALSVATFFSACDLITTPLMSVVPQMRKEDWEAQPIEHGPSGGALSERARILNCYGSMFCYTLGNIRTLAMLTKHRREYQRQQDD